MSIGIKIGKPEEIVLTASPSTPTEVEVKEDTADLISLAENLENLNSWLILLSKVDEAISGFGGGNDFENK